jgi:hypothetical protein
MNLELISPEKVLLENWNKVNAAIAELQAAKSEIERKMLLLDMEVPSDADDKATDGHVPQGDLKLDSEERAISALSDPRASLAEKVKEISLSLKSNITKPRVVNALKGNPFNQYSGSAVSSALSRLASEEGFLIVTEQGGRGRTSVYALAKNQD